MVGSDTSWEVLPHGPIEQLENNLWRVQGTLPRVPLQRVMTLARLDDGRVVIHSAIALDEEEMDVVENWGCPALLVVPNGYHRHDALAYKSRYPDLTVLCPRAAQRRVAEVVPVDGDLKQFPSQTSVRCGHLDGTGEGEGFLLVRHGETATLVLNDIVFNMPHVPGFVGWTLKNVTRSSGGPTVSRVARWLFIKDRTKLQQHLERLAKVPGLERIIVSHHEVIDHEPSETLRRIASTL